MRKHAVPGSRELPLGLINMYEDRDIIVVDKPAGLLTVGTDREKIHTAHFVLGDYVRKGQMRSKAQVFVVHRLDRETSGVLVFAKSEQAKLRLQKNWDEVQKTYLAVVVGRVEMDAHTITSYLAENSAYVVYETKDPNLGKFAKTSFRVLGRTQNSTLVEVNLLTGRKHQIRVHMASIGHPVVGDTRHSPIFQKGTRVPTADRMALHSWSLTFPHPTTGETMTFRTEIPREFMKGFPRESFDGLI